MLKDMLKQRRMVGAELGACCVPRTAKLTRSLALRLMCELQSCLPVGSFYTRQLLLFRFGVFCF